MNFHKNGGFFTNRVRICCKGMAYLPANYAFFICDHIFNCSYCHIYKENYECLADEKLKFHWINVKGHGILGLFKEEEI